MVSYKDLGLVNTREMFAKAIKGGYAIPAFNFNNMEQMQAIIQAIKELHATGQPVLVGTISIETSELISQLLKREGVPHSVLNAKHHEKEAEIVAQAVKVLNAVAEKYGKSEAQILVRWCIQHDTLPLPKTATLSRIPENADVFNFEISTEDMAALDAVKSVGRLGPHPDRGKY